MQEKLGKLLYEQRDVTNDGIRRVSLHYAMDVVHAL
jgi:hypothetical protein